MVIITWLTKREIYLFHILSQRFTVFWLNCVSRFFIKTWMEHEEFKLKRPKKTRTTLRVRPKLLPPSLIIDVTYKGHSHLARWTSIALYFTAHTHTRTVSKIAPAVRMMRQTCRQIVFERLCSRLGLHETKYHCWHVAVWYMCTVSAFPHGTSLFKVWQVLGKNTISGRKFDKKINTTLVTD